MNLLDKLESISSGQQQLRKASLMWPDIPQGRLSVTWHTIGRIYIAATLPWLEN